MIKLRKVGSKSLLLRWQRNDWKPSNFPNSNHLFSFDSTYRSYHLVFLTFCGDWEQPAPVPEAVSKERLAATASSAVRQTLPSALMKYMSVPAGVSSKPGKGPNPGRGPKPGGGLNPGGNPTTHLLLL